MVHETVAISSVVLSVSRPEYFCPWQCCEYYFRSTLWPNFTHRLLLSSLCSFHAACSTLALCWICHWWNIKAFVVLSASRVAVLQHWGYMINLKMKRIILMKKWISKPSGSKLKAQEEHIKLFVLKKNNFQTFFLDRHIMGVSFNPP